MTKLGPTSKFSVGSASEEYPLTVGGFTGVGNNQFIAVRTLNGMKFSTPDNDNNKDGSNCATKYSSGRWYNSCYCININKQPPSELVAMYYSLK